MDYCKICLSSDFSIKQASDYDGYIIQCGCCGIYKISGSLIGTDIIDKYANKYILSAVIRESNELTQSLIELNTTNIESYLSESRLPMNIEEKLNKILLYIYRHTQVAGRFCLIDTERDYPIAFAVNGDECLYLLTILFNNGLIETDCDEDDLVDSMNNFRLTFHGWNKVDQLRVNQRITGNQCFVAMAFDDDLKDVYDNGIELGIEDAGYKARRIDLVEHNEYIPDKIIAEIRKSRLMVADFTHQKNGVYFEAGFAMGLNIPVIWTCRENDLKNSHFDTKQFNHILWSNPKELRERLKNRILAIAPL